MLQGSCSPDNHVSSPTDEAVEAFFASVQAEKVDISGGLQQRVQEEGAQVEVVGAQDEGMSIGCGAAGSEDEVAEMEEGMTENRCSEPLLKFLQELLTRFFPQRGCAIPR